MPNSTETLHKSIAAMLREPERNRYLAKRKWERECDEAANVGAIGPRLPPELYDD